MDPAKTYVVRRRALTEVEVLHAGRRVATFKAPLQVAGAGDATTLGGHGTYRGVMEFKPGTFSGLTVTNVVGLDDYLQGVVPAESPASWPAEALRAQAIAARTYAITTAKSADFDHYADTRSQVYKGVGIEQPSTNAAVADTRGQIVTYQGQPVVTYFFSTSGGKTESVENTSLGREPRPWLVSVEDEFDNVSPRHRWTSKPTMASASKKLGGLVKGSFKGIKVTRRGVSPRIVTAEVVGSRGRTVTDGATLRARLGLFDTWASFTSISGEADEPTDGDASGGATAPPGFSTLVRPIGALRGTVISDSRAVKIQAQARRALARGRRDQDAPRQVPLGDVGRRDLPRRRGRRRRSRSARWASRCRRGRRSRRRRPACRRPRVRRSLRRRTGRRRGRR